MWSRWLNFSHSSASDRHLQCDWGGAGCWSERCGAERRHLCDQTGELGVLPVQPAQQAPAHHTHHQPSREHRPVSRILTGRRWQVHTEKSEEETVYFLHVDIQLFKYETSTCVTATYCSTVSHVFVCAFFVSVSQTAVWQCSPWKRCWPCCVEGNW